MPTKKRGSTWVLKREPKSEEVTPSLTLTSNINISPVVINGRLYCIYCQEPWSEQKKKGYCDSCGAPKEE